MQTTGRAPGFGQAAEAGVRGQIRPLSFLGAKQDRAKVNSFELASLNHFSGLWAAALDSLPGTWLWGD